MTTPLSIHADLVVEVDGQSAELLADGSVVTLRTPSASVLKKLIPGYLAGRPRRHLVEQLHSFLCRADLQLEMHVGGRRVARIGNGIRPSWLAKLFRLGPIEIGSRDAFHLLFS